MRLPLWSALLALAVLIPAGCTRVPVQEPAEVCPAADWHEYGRNDGLLGVSAEARIELFAECRALGHPPDLDAYQAGRAEGLREYCTVENGYQVARQGRSYRDVCPPELETGFLQGYEQGRKDRLRDYAYRYPPHAGYGYYGAPYWWYGYPYGPYYRHWPYWW